MLPAHSELCKGSRNAEAERCKLQRFDISALPSLQVQLLHVRMSAGACSFRLALTLLLLLLPALQREEGEGIPSTRREVVLAKTEVPDDEWV